MTTIRAASLSSLSSIRPRAPSPRTPRWSLGSMTSRRPADGSSWSERSPDGSSCSPGCSDAVAPDRLPLAGPRSSEHDREDHRARAREQLVLLAACRARTSASTAARTCPAAAAKATTHDRRHPPGQQQSQRCGRNDHVSDRPNRARPDGRIERGHQDPHDRGIGPGQRPPERDRAAQPRPERQAAEDEEIPGRKIPTTAINAPTTPLGAGPSTVPR